VARTKRNVVDPLEEELVAGEELPEADEEAIPKPSAAAKPAQRFDADAILDTLVPPSVDWRGTVRRHPVVSVAAVALVGYLVGRTKGAAIITGATAGLSSALMRQLSDVFEGDFFDF
jgi:hypothetical protein